MAALNKPLGFLKYNVGNFHVPFCRLVKCGCNNFCLNAAGHICNLLRPFVYKEYNHINFRVIVCYCICNLLKEHCLTGLWLCNNESALSFSDRGEHIHNAARKVVVSVCCKFKFLVGEERGKEIERYPVPYIFRASSVYLVYLYKWEVFVTLPWRPYLSEQGITCFKSEKLYLGLRYIDVIR